LLNAILAAIPRTYWGILNAAAFTAILKLMGDSEELYATAATHPGFSMVILGKNTPA